MKEIKQNEARVYCNSLYKKNRVYLIINNNWFSKEFVYKVKDDRVIFSRPTIDANKIPSKSTRIGNGFRVYLSLKDEPVNKRLTIFDEDIDEDQAILYL